MTDVNKKSSFRINTNAYDLWISAPKLWITIYPWWTKLDSGESYPK